ncbi:MAG: DNA polymerase III subunit beta [Clostridia bacterium]
MQLICDGLDLADAVFKVSRAIPSKTTNPILEGIKVVAEDDTLTLSATDLELSIEKKIKADVKVEGQAVVPGRFFSEFIKKLTNDKIELELNDKKQLKIKYNGSKSYIQCFDSQEYPAFKKLETKDYFAISKSNFKQLITKSIFAVAIDDSRPILKGVLVLSEDKKLTAVALDGYRLAMVNQQLVESTVNVNAIVPSKSLAEIAKLLGDTDEIINVYVQKNYIMVDNGDTKILSRLIEGEFLNYNQILATSFDTKIIINKAQFEDALERASLLSKVGQNNLVKLTITNGNLCVTSNSELGNVTENVAITLEGKDIAIAFNARYFTECFRAYNQDMLAINFNNPNNPCIITPVEGNEFLCLILPVRVLT